MDKYTSYRLNRSRIDFTKEELAQAFKDINSLPYEYKRSKVLRKLESALQRLGVKPGSL